MSTQPLPLKATLDAHLPVLLLPVSVQVKFVHTPATGSAPEQYELRVRFYPDQLGINAHQLALKADEQAAGEQYWQQAPPHERDRWRALVARFGVPRASWILRQTSTLGRNQAPATVEANWTTPAYALGLPDYFSVLLYTATTAAEAQAARTQGTGLPATESPAGQLLFRSATSQSYSPDRVPAPTTEFLTLRQAVDGAALGSQALSVGLHPDPTAAAATDVLGVDAGNKWTVDFEEALRVGMAVRLVFSTRAEYETGFDRLVVVGVRQATPQASQQALEQLLSAHYYTDGVQLLAQGTPTNNTDAVAAGYSSGGAADADAAFELLSQSATYDASTPWGQRPDGQHLAEALGLSTAQVPTPGAPPALPAVPTLAGGQARDVGEAQLLNRALWPATYGYFLEEMLRPLLSTEALDWTRRLFEDHVLARGLVPALRVGTQPYGVLPTTQFSAWQAPAADRYARQLQAVLGQLDAVWTERLNPQPGLYPDSFTRGASQTGFVAPPTDSPNLLTKLALDATSTEYYQRYLIGPILTEALASYASATDDADGTRSSIWAAAAADNGHYDPTQNLIYQEFTSILGPVAAQLPAAAPPIFGQAFQSAYTKLADAFADEPGARRGEGMLLDDHPLSETAPLAPFGGLNAAGRALSPNPARATNYADWLARASYDEVRLENFTAIVAADRATEFVAPNSLLYSLLRQAVLQAYWQAALRFYDDPQQAGVRAGLPAPSAGQRVDTETFNVLSATDRPRWSWLYAQVQPQSEPDPLPLYAYLPGYDDQLRASLAAVAELAELPTARLERLLAEHLDLGSYRLDAWRLAPVAQRLRELRQDGSRSQSHLGVFGWLEGGRPTDTSRLAADGTRADPDNLGYLHAPSLTHGTAAAILRQGYKSRQRTVDPQDPAIDRMAVDVSSRRVRAALELLEGLRGGHSLGALLGQRFERALTQHPGTAGGRPYAAYIGAFRRAYPLADEATLPADQAGLTTGIAPEQALRQVIDGAALLRDAAQRRAYPYGAALDQPAGSDFARFVEEQVAQLVDELDALGDLTVTEGIYQAARGNAERAGAVLESAAQGQFPSNPDIVHPASRSLTLTQRVLVQLPRAGTLAGWPTALYQAGPTPRALAAPRLNAWLGQFFPAPADVLFALGYRAPNGDWLTQQTLPLTAAGLQPLDLLYLLDDSALQRDSALDRLLLHAFAQQALTQPAAPIPDGTVLALDYDAAPAALRQRLPLLARLRQLLGAARPATSPDLQAPGQLPAVVAPPALSQGLAAARQGLADLVAGPALTPGQLYQLALYGLDEALPALATGQSAAAQTVAVELAYQAAQARLRATSVAPTDLTTELSRAAGLFGAAFRPDVEFTLAGPANAAYQAALAPSAAERLLRHQPNSALAVQEWLHGLAPVREPLNHLDKVLFIQGLLHPELSGAPLSLTPAQLVTQPGRAADGQGDYWLGLDWPTEPRPDAQGQLVAYNPPGDALSLVQWLPAGYQPGDAQCALWLDEWTETLPLPAQTTALTFHFDQPNTEAPQTLLLVVPPKPLTAIAAGEVWTIETLAGALNETLDLAKKRTVEPDALAFTPLATVLPAVVTPVAQEAVTHTLDFGRLNDSARFNEEALRLA